MSHAIIEPVAAILCDQVRVEMGGKLIAIGCLGPDVSVSSFSSLLNFSTLLIVNVKEPGSTELHFEVVNAREENIIGAIGTTEAMKAEKGTIMPGPVFNVQLKEPDRLTLNFRQSVAEDWTPMMSWNFALAS